MTEPAILVLCNPVEIAAADALRAGPAPPTSERFRTVKARKSFQPVEQLLARLDRRRPAPACA